jgi:hypothetical protein
MSCAFTAMAANHGDEGGQTGVTLDDLRAKCAEFAADDQLKPVKAVVTCNQLSYVWVPAAAKPGQLANTLNVGASVQMKGFHVNEQLFPVATDATPVQCLNFVKMERKVGNIDVEMQCADLDNITDLSAFCQPIIADRLAADPGLLTERPTSETQSFCPSSVLH